MGGGGGGYLERHLNRDRSGDSSEKNFQQKEHPAQREGVGRAWCHVRERIWTFTPRDERAMEGSGQSRDKPTLAPYDGLVDRMWRV